MIKVGYLLKSIHFCASCYDVLNPLQQLADLKLDKKFITENNTRTAILYPIVKLGNDWTKNLLPHIEILPEYHTHAPFYKEMNTFLVAIEL